MSCDERCVVRVIFMPRVAGGRSEGNEVIAFLCEIKALKFYDDFMYFHTICDTLIYIYMTSMSITMSVVKINVRRR